MSTEEQKTRFLAALEHYKQQPGSLLPVLQSAQEIFGWLPRFALEIAAEELDLPLEKLYGVASFYSQFSFSPKGRFEISVCMGTACYVKGAEEILQKVTKILKIEPEECTPDGNFFLTASRCVGACGLAPVMSINGKVFPRVSPDEVAKILDEYAEMAKGNTQ